MEIWKFIPNTNNCYSVSNYGNIRSNQRYGKNNYSIREKILQPGKNNKGYLKVDLIVNDIRYSKLVHRLVAESFLDNYSEKLQVNHIDGNKLNNAVTNLEMVTCSENYKHAYKLGLMKVTDNKRKGWQKTALHNILTQGQPIYKYSLSNEYLESFLSKNAVVKKYGYSSATLTKAANNNRPVYGFLWKWKKD